MERFKKCTACSKVKPRCDFYIRRKSNGGISPNCKSCERLRVRNKRRTASGLLAAIYDDQKASSRHRCHPLPAYTLSQFREEYINDETFTKLYNDWAKSGYTTYLRPSFDRKDDSKGYSFRNLNRWMTWRENELKSYSDVRSGKIIHGSKPQKAVVQLKDGIKVNEFVSESEASRQSGIDFSSIAKVCRNERNHAGGFQWRFKETIKTKA